MRTLVVEDEPKTAAYLKEGLTENGSETDIAFDGEEGLRMALANDYDLIILDVMLPIRDGWSVMEELRHAQKLIPIIFLTARDAIGEKVRGLDLGADDYLVKPFAFSELLARIRSIMRRGPERQLPSLRISDLEIDFMNDRAVRGGVRLELTPKEYSLLSLLARRAGEILGRALIAKQVWEMEGEVDTNLVDVAIRRLRRKVDAPFSKPLIQTVYGVGYVLEER
jgi:two-component system, OmpR family, copper resistance phosphate regulon response regulator CusR